MLKILNMITSIYLYTKKSNIFHQKLILIILPFFYHLLLSQQLDKYIVKDNCQENFGKYPESIHGGDHGKLSYIFT